MKKRIASLLLLSLFLCLILRPIAAFPDSFAVSSDSIGPARILPKLPFGGVLTAPPEQREKPLAERVTLFLMLGLLAFLLFLPKRRPCLSGMHRAADKRSDMKRYLSPYIFGSRFRKGAFSLIE